MEAAVTMTTPARGMVEADADAARLAELEEVIERGLQSFVEVGNALIEVKAKRLFKVAGFDTFDAYCEQKFCIRSSQRVRLMTAAATHEALVRDLAEIAPAGANPTPPSTERQIRSLAGLAPKIAAELWAELTVVFGELDTTGPAVEAAAILVKQGGIEPGNAATCVYGWSQRGANVIDEARERVALPDPLGCSVCGEALVYWDGDDRCTECIEACRFPLSAETEARLHGGQTPVPGDAAVTAGDGDTAVASPATNAAPVPPTVEQSSATAPTSGGVVVGEELPPAPAPTATDVVTPDEVIAPKAKPVKSQRDAFEDDYVKHLRRLAAAAGSWSYLAKIDEVTSGSRSRILSRLTEDEAIALTVLANATGIGSLS